MSSLFQTIDSIKLVYDRTYVLSCSCANCSSPWISSLPVWRLRDVTFRLSIRPEREVVLTRMAYMAVLSAALAIRRNAHIRMTAFDTHSPQSRWCGPWISSRRRRALPCSHQVITVGWKYAKGIGSKGFLREHALAVQVLMYFPVPGRRGNADI